MSQVEERLKAFRDRVKFLTYENLTDQLRHVTDPQANAMAAFLEARIETVCRNRGL